LTDPVTFFWLVLKASLLSSGGQGNLPSLHQDFLARGWASDSQFAAALAVGQVSPGPGGLWVVSFGYLVGGLSGATLAALAVVVPPMLVLPVGRLHRRFGHNAAVRGFVRGIVLVVAATVPVVFLRILAAYGLDVREVLIVVSCVVILASRRIPVIGVMALGSIVGLLLYH
jgi:chromate transporter